MARIRNRIVRAQGAFGNANKNKRKPAPVGAGRILGKAEMDALCTVAFYDQRPAMKKALGSRGILWEAKSPNIRQVLERVDRYLENRLLEKKKRQMFESIQAKLRNVLRERQSFMAK